jgi:uncharacterized protein (PEP-CTERM system associated)
MDNPIWRTARRALVYSLVVGVGLAPLPATAGDWTATKSLGGQEVFTDNVFLTPTNTKSDFITVLAPAIEIRGDSDRLTGVLDYSPSAYVYALNPSLDTVSQRFNGNGTAVLVPNHLLLDVQGYAADIPVGPATSLFGFGPTFSPAGPSFFGTGGNTSPGVLPNASTQTTTFTASPYVVQRFRDFGAAELRYTVSNTSFGSPPTTPALPTGFAPPTGNTLTNEGTASFLTGSRFGPLASRLTFDTVETSGAVIPSNQNIVVLNSAYAIDRRLAAIATIGYEEFRYTSLPPVRFSDAVWGVGARLTPNPSSTITLRYGHQSGITGPYLDATYAVTARTTLVARYSEEVGTSVQGIEGLLAQTTLNAQGQSVNRLTGVPESLNDPFVFGLQNTLSRTKTLEGQAFVHLQRDDYSVAVYRYQSSVIATGVSGTGVSGNATQANANWTRRITPLLNSTIGVGYSRDTFSSSGNAPLGLFSAGVSVSYLLPHSMTAWAGYYFLKRTSDDPLFRITSNTAIVGLSKSF